MLTTRASCRGRSRGFERMMVVFVEISGAFDLTISARKVQTVCMSVPRTPAMQIVFNATGQQFRQTASSTYLVGVLTETSKLWDEIDRRIRSG